MRVLVTGATGFLGSNLVHGFLSEGHEVIIVKRSTSDCTRLAGIRDKIVSYDLDRSPLEAPFRERGRIDAVVHTATCYGRKGESPAAVFSVNTAFALQVLECSALNNCGCFINADTSLPRSLNAYTLSKKQFVEWGLVTASATGVRFVNLVMEHFYGPGDDESKITTSLIRNCLANVPAVPLTLGDQQRDFIYIDDVVAGYIAVLRSSAAVTDPFITYAIGSGNPVTIKTLAETIRQLTGSTTRLDFGAIPYRRNEVMRSCADTGPLRKLGWKPAVSLDEGLRRTIDFERTRRI
jgi:nucleoside-diphosphate-sugar epimerase